MVKKLKFIFFLLILSLSLIINKNVYGQQIDDNINLVITFNNSINNSLEEYIVQSGGHVISELPDIGAIEVNCNPKLIPKIKNYSDVNSISPETTIKLPQYKTIRLNEDINLESNTENHDLFNNYQWDIKKVTNNGESFNLERGNHNVVVGIIDTGVDKDHPDLKMNFLGGQNFVPKDFENDSTETGNINDIEDRVGHGTHIAGTIAGNGRIEGVAPNIGFKVYRIFNSSEETNDSIIASAIIKATKDKVNVINLSLGGYEIKGNCYWTDPSTGKEYNLGGDMAEYSIYKKAIQYAIDHGVTVVTSAGNDSLNCDDKKSITDYLNNKYSSEGFKYVGLGIEVPGTIKGVINVSATSIDNNLASYSNYGSGFIDIAAPGGDLKNINDPNSYYQMCLSTYLKDSYVFMDGTSMAAPKVSATAALVISRYGNIGPKNIARKIYESAQKLEVDNSHKYFGHGLVNAYNALNIK